MKVSDGCCWFVLFSNLDSFFLKHVGQPWCSGRQEQLAAQQQRQAGDCLQMQCYKKITLHTRLFSSPLFKYIFCFY